MNVQSIPMTEPEGISGKEKAIYESSLELVAKYGFHGSSMSLLSKEAGVATGTIYHYFSGKDDLMKKMYCHYRYQLENWVLSRMDEKQSYKERFYIRWLNLYLFYTQNPNVLVFFEQYINSPYNKERSPHHFTGAYFEFLKEGIRENQLKPAKPEIYVAMYIGSVVMAAKITVFGSILLNKNDREIMVKKLWDGMSLV